MAGLLHDLGKYSLAFQQRLQGAALRVDHAAWGARIACQRYGPIGLMLAYTVAGHHAGLANGKGGAARTALADRLTVDLHALHPAWQHELALPGPDQLRLPAHFQPCRQRQGFQLAFLIRMLYSCVVDADFIDTDAFYRRIAGQALCTAAPCPPTLAQLRQQLDARLAALAGQAGDVNAWRAQVLEHVRQQAAQERGLFSLTVPTGGGKTLTSLAFALDHALHHGLQRVIYVIPYTSVIEQTADVFRKALAPGAKPPCWSTTAALSMPGRKTGKGAGAMRVTNCARPPTTGMRPSSSPQPCSFSRACLPIAVRAAASCTAWPKAWSFWTRRKPCRASCCSPAWRPLMNWRATTAARWCCVRRAR